VRFADLDLTNPSDVAKLHQRIWAAARDVCRTARVLSLYDGSYLQQCTRYSARRALVNVDASAGTRLAGEIK